MEIHVTHPSIKPSPLDLTVVNKKCFPLTQVATWDYMSKTLTCNALDWNFPAQIPEQVISFSDNIFDYEAIRLTFSPHFLIA